MNRNDVYLKMYQQRSVQAVKANSDRRYRPDIPLQPNILNRYGFYTGYSVISAKHPFNFILLIFMSQECLIIRHL